MQTFTKKCNKSYDRNNGLVDSDNEGQIWCHAVADETTKHIQALVKKQKGKSKKKGRRGGRGEGHGMGRAFKVSIKT